MPNEEQKAAVEHFLGPALVLAGPGSGKTMTVTHRAARLMERGVPPEEIALVTFTRKAAGEMKERLLRLAGEAAEGVWVSTFHALAAAILREANPSLRVLDAEDAQRLLAALIKELKAEWEDSARVTPRTVQGALSLAANTGLPLPELLKKYPTDLHPYLRELFHLYPERKRALGYLDFDDLLQEAPRALEEDPALRARWQTRTRFLIVDEYQDTNPIQARLVSLLLTPERNVMVVGDPNQAIYSWRGADSRLIRIFRDQYPDARVYTLATNYRSHRGMVDTALFVIRRAFDPVVLPLKALRDGPDPLKVVAETREDEAHFVAEAIRHTLETGVPPEEIAVLMRSTYQSRPLEQALREKRIPYSVVGLSFWNRREVKLLLNLLRAARYETLALADLIALYVPGFGEKRALEAAEDPSLLEKRAEGRVVLDLVARARSLTARKGLDLYWAVYELVHAYREAFFDPILLDLAEGVEEAAEERWKNVKEALRALEAFARRNPEGDLDLFLSDVLLEEADLGEAGEGVRLMTLHASKGLEFHTVFIIGLVDGVLPSRRSRDSQESYEEERRLFYVGITRAKEELFLTTYVEGERGLVMESPFLAEIPHLPTHRYDPRAGYHGRKAGSVVSELSRLAGEFDF